MGSRVANALGTSQLKSPKGQQIWTYVPKGMVSDDYHHLINKRH